MSTDLQSKRIYRCHSDKHFSQFLPTRWRRLSTGIDKEQNYATVTLCIQRSDQYFCCSPVRVLLLHYTRLMALFPGLPRWAATRKVKPIWILLKQETASGSGISWAICKSAPHTRQTTAPAPHHSVFYRPDALPVAQPTASKHWRHNPGEGMCVLFATPTSCRPSGLVCCTFF